MRTIFEKVEKKKKKEFERQRENQLDSSLRARLGEKKGGSTRETIGLRARFRKKGKGNGSLRRDGEDIPKCIELKHEGTPHEPGLKRKITKQRGLGKVAGKEGERTQKAGRMCERSASMAAPGDLPGKNL